MPMLSPRAVQAGSDTMDSVLDLLLERMWNDGRFFILVVTHLLGQLRQQKAALIRPGAQLVHPQAQSSLAPHTAQPSTLPVSGTAWREPVTIADLLDDNEADGPKRKRQVSHFQGIPISVIRQGSQGTQERMPPGPRRVVTPKRLAKLDKAVARMGMQVRSGENNDDDDDESDSDDDVTFIV